MKQLTIGEKYYRTIEDGSIDIIRVHKINNEKITIERGTSLEKVDISYFDNYIRLNPDAFIFFNVVTMGELKNNTEDVVVCLNRRKDLDNSNGVPYAACRQNIYDPFSNQINRTANIYLGVSMSIDTVPENVPYQSLIACNGIKYSEKIAVYIDDNLDNILKLVNKVSMFDSVLYKLNKTLEGTEFVGTSDSLLKLLKENDFMYDFHSAFNIYEVPFEVKLSNEYELERQQLIILEDIIKAEIFRAYVLRYSKDINLNKAERNYMLINDTMNNLYIVIYDKGEYINRKYRDNIRDKRDAVMLIKNARDRYKK